jgi:hypothetical protein
MIDLLLALLAISLPILALLSLLGFPVLVKRNQWLSPAGGAWAVSVIALVMWLLTIWNFNNAADANGTTGDAFAGVHYLIVALLLSGAATLYANRHQNSANK